MPFSVETKRASFSVCRADLSLRIGRLDLYASRDRDRGRGYWFSLIRGDADVELIFPNAAVTVSWGIVQNPSATIVFALRRARKVQPERQPAAAE